MRSRFIDRSGTEHFYGLQSGELYEQTEECHTHITNHRSNGRSFEVFYDEMASPLSQWKAFSQGIGTVSGWERERVIEAMRVKLGKV